MKLKNLGYAALMIVATAAFVLGAAGSSEAKGKKKMAPVPQPFCGTVYSPVCAVKGGGRYTYANSCFAGNDGASVVSNKPCLLKKAKKHGKKKMTKKSKKKKHMKKAKKAKKKPMKKAAKKSMKKK